MKTQDNGNLALLYTCLKLYGHLKALVGHLLLYS